MTQADLENRTWLEVTVEPSVACVACVACVVSVNVSYHRMHHITECTTHKNLTTFIKH